MGNLKHLLFYLLNMMSLCSYVFTHEISSVRYISMFGIRVEWKDTKRFTWFCVTQYFDSRFLIWYSWFDSSETQVTCSTISTATEYQRKYSFHSRIDTVCNEIRRNNTVEIPYRNASCIWKLESSIVTLSGQRVLIERLWLAWLPESVTYPESFWKPMNRGPWRNSRMEKPWTHSTV